MAEHEQISSAPGAAQQNPQRGVADEVHGAAGQDDTRDVIGAPTGVQGEEGGGAPDAGAAEDSLDADQQDGFEGLQPHRKY